MNRLTTKLLAIVFGTMLFMSCNYNRNKAKPDIWFDLEITTNTPIRNMYAGDIEMHLITDDEFIRINNQNQLIERRLFPDLPTKFYGRPSMSRYAFTWVVLQDDVEQLEVHLVKDLSSEKTFIYDLSQLPGINEEPDALVLIPDESGRYNGTFNADGSQFLLPMLNASSNIYSFYLFDINLNFDKTEFVQGGVVIDKRIDLPIDDISGDLMNTQFINGYYYITTKRGAFRIDPLQGNFTEINQVWMLDAFGYDGQVYLTGFNDFDFYVSNDNGLSFEQAGTSPLKYVEVENNHVLSQTQLGLPWSLADDDLLGIQELRVNKDFEDDGASYWNIRHFYGRYYLSIQKEVYFLEELETE